jgi:ABC-2 type transport system permease protein
MIVLVVATGVFALAYSGFGMAIALKTGSPQAANAGFILFFPLLFLAPTFAPVDVFATWLEVVASVNPVTYILEGMRGLITEGWDAAELLWAALAIGGMGALTFMMTALALRGRAGQ